MKLANLSLGIMVGMASIGTSTFAMEKPSEQTSQSGYDSSTVSIHQKQNAGVDVDYERDKFFEIHFIPRPDHASIATTFGKNMRNILDTTKVSSPDQGEKSPTTQENYRRYLLLKGMTSYDLPPTFEKGYLFSFTQAMNALEKLGIDRNLLQEIDQDKFWMFSIRCLELPPAKIDYEDTVNEDEAEDKDAVLSSYLSLVEELISRFDKRLKEDSFALIGFIALKGNILNQSGISKEGSEEIGLKFINLSYTRDTITTEQSIIKRIVANRGYKTEGLDAVLAPIDSLHPLNTFKRLCNALNEGRIQSWNPGDYLSVSVRVAEKLAINKTDDITPELLEVVDHLLVRAYNKLILEEIRENFIKALAPKKKGFDNDLPYNDLI